MKRLAILALLGSAAAMAQTPDNWWERLRATVEKHLGRPYVWGATGLKSFDCSGFVWRAFTDAGAPFKRTTARKLYFSLNSATKGKEWDFGNVVFFDDLKHCGIVNSRGDFFHAESSKGTTLSRFDPYWRPKVYGIRRVAVLQ
ncbi:MAG: C40 family peptidase [Acidobacteria bacterium]|nr:C40 family peptidase [Acidobacteriota bacterium]